MVEKLYDDDDRYRFWACIPALGRDSKHIRRHGFRNHRFLGAIVCDTIDTCGWEIAIAPFAVDPKVAFTQGSCSRYSSSDCATYVRVFGLESRRSASTAFGTTSGSRHTSM